MSLGSFQDSLKEFSNNVIALLQKEVDKLEKEYDRTQRRLEKVLKQSDSQHKQLITLHKQLQDSYAELDEYRMKLEEKVNEKVRELLDAKLDPLTKIPNRGMFNEMFPEIIKASRDNGNKFAIMFIDLDKFKHINDTMGHDAGDEILIGAVGRIKNIIGDNNFVSRLGGDEFVVILPNINELSIVREFANKIVLDMSLTFYLSA